MQPWPRRTVHTRRSPATGAWPAYDSKLARSFRIHHSSKEICSKDNYSAASRLDAHKSGQPPPILDAISAAAIQSRHPTIRRLALKNNRTGSRFETLRPRYLRGQSQQSVPYATALCHRRYVRPPARPAEARAILTNGERPHSISR